jgi:serine protease Do
MEFAVSRTCSTLLLILLGTFSSIQAQDFPLSSDPPKYTSPLDRSSFKPSIPSITPRDQVKGITSVPIEPGLESILKGNEPRNKQELIALEKQQTKIAAKANLVTVNLQHGSTQGSGVIITGDGYILTAAHVAGRPKQRISIILHDGTRIEGVTRGVNRNMDAGLIKITSPERDVSRDPWPHATLGASTDLEQGQWCIATGHPGGWMADRPAVLRVGRLLRMLPSTLITDCALIGGDSGGPLFDLTGKLIGIHSRIGVDVDDNMHVPADVFRQSWSRMVNGEAWGTLPGFKPAIGVRGEIGPDDEKVCRISRVDEGGPAAKAGIQSGDIIVRFDGILIGNFDNLKEAVESVTPGDRVTVELLRDEKRISIPLIVGVRE